jgi:hypothetical protein
LNERVEEHPEKFSAEAIISIRKRFEIEKSQFEFVNSKDWRATSSRDIYEPLIAAVMRHFWLTQG